MGFVNFLKGITAQVNPFDNGKTYGSYNPPKRKPQPGDPGYVAPPVAPKPTPQVSNPLSVQQPQNHFDTGITPLSLPGAPSNTATPLGGNTNLAPLIKPQPGQVVKPTNTLVQPQSQNNQPKNGMVQAQGVTGTRGSQGGQNGVFATNKVTGKQNFIPDAPAPQNNSVGSKIGRFFGGAKDLAVGTVSNIPEVGMAAVRAGTGLVQGVTQVPHIVTAATATGTEALANKFSNPVTRGINRGFQDANTGTKNVTTVINKPINAINRGIDSAAQGYAAHVPTAYNGAQLYKTEQIPLNVLAGLVTLGGSTAAEGAGAAGEAGQTGRVASVVNKFQDLLNKPLTSNTDNIVSKTSQAISNKTAPVVNALNTPLSSSKNAVTKLIGNKPNVVTPLEKGLIDAGETGNVMNGVEELTKPPTQIQVQQPTPIEVQGAPGEPTSIPVTNNTPQGAPIREFPGDTPGTVRVPNANEIAAQRAHDAFNAQDAGRPDQSVSGINPTSKVITKADKQAYQGVLDDKLATNQLTADEHKALSDQLDKIPAHDDVPATDGKKINVKQVDSIPIQNQTDVPTGLPETPGTVRATATAAPAKSEAEAVANAPTVAAPASLPKEVQNVLDNPKQFNKRQVAAARNQAKMAKQTAKAQEATQAAISRMESASPTATSAEGHVPTGEFGQGENGIIQKVSRQAEMSQAKTETAQMSPKDAIKTARDNQTANGQFNRRDIRNIMAMFESKRIPRGSPEFNEAKAILKEDGTTTAQALALRGGNVIRRTATPDQLVSQYESKIYRLADDPSKIDSKAFDDVETATNKFTDARDAATAAYNRFTEAPTHGNAQAYHAAQDAAETADKESKMTEFKVAQKVLKGNKDTNQVRELQKMAKDADLYQMDGIDASMLSGTGTFARNLVNSAVGGTEEGLFGGLASRIANKLTGENVGGGFGRGSLSGFGKGTRNVVDASKARASNAGWNPLEHLKNWATTGNQLGDSIIDSQVSHNVLDHYTQTLKDEGGYTGRELKDRASVMARQDPDEVGKVYAGYAKAAAGLGSGIAKGSKAETVIKNGISDFLSHGNPNTVSETAAKLITRMTVGFPSAVGRTIIEGGKRATLGVPTALGLFTKAARDDPAVRAQIIKESIKQAGSGATTGAIFYKLGQDGIVTGSYPTDPAERARWQREGITENSIKIGDNYYQLPSYLGSAALPALFAATLGRNNGDVAKSAGEVAKGIPTILPTDQASNVLDWINGKTNSGKFLTQTGASAVRALTPAGALLNQVAKSFDPTQNDTTSGSALENFMDKVISGIPGENKFANIPDKVDDQGNPIHNPGAVPLALGASTTVQNKGVEATQNINDQTNTQLKAINDTGALSDKNILAVLGTDAASKKIYDEIQAGKQVQPKDLAKLQAALTKGVPNNGDDTAYLEKGQYDSNLSALNLKRQILAADPTTKPSELKQLDLNIRRSQVYKDNNISYDDITAYKGTSLADWRKMGDDTSDSYDPETYNKLWQMDQLMTKANASDNTKNPAEGKYSAKAPGKGSAGSVAGGWSSGFGQLKAGTGAPTVQNYQTISQASGQIPSIQTVHPNIVHKISSSG